MSNINSFPQSTNPNSEPASSVETSEPDSDDQSEQNNRIAEISFDNLAPTDNMEQVGEVLYLVDQYIFPDLFGSEEKAKVFAKELFSEDPNALFSYQKTLVAKNSHGEIVGILAYRDENCTSWDKGTITAKFQATGLALSENFERANDKYMSKVTDAELPAGAAEIEFVGVHKNYRRLGIGGKLMQQVIGNPKYSEVHLDVLDSHPGARKFYDELGFKPSGDKFGNYPNGTEGVQHMILQK